MSPNIRSLFLIVFVVGFLVGCAAPATIAPTPTQSPPTQPAPTSTPGISIQQVDISTGEDNETINATVTGKGEIAIIIANTGEAAISDWAPLVDALETNKNLRIVTFAYRDVYSTGDKDVTAVLDYLRAEGIKKTVCIGAGIGSRFCANRKQEPDIIGMVLIATNGLAIDADFPKLFLTTAADPFRMAGSTERVYNQSAEPKVFKTYPASVHGPALFFKEDVGPQVLADITDFINGIIGGP